MPACPPGEVQIQTSLGSLICEMGAGKGERRCMLRLSARKLRIDCTQTLGIMLPPPLCRSARRYRRPERANRLRVVCVFVHDFPGVCLRPRVVRAYLLAVCNAGATPYCSVSRRRTNGITEETEAAAQKGKIYRNQIKGFFVGRSMCVYDFS